MVELLRITEDPEELIEYAGRVCYRSGPGNMGAFIRKAIARGHLSIVEHASATFEIYCSRACSHQIVRHRIASYSQESQRYCEGGDFETIVPDAIAEDPDSMQVWETTMARIRWAYGQLREAGILKEDARFLLPNAAQTRLVVTMNFRELLHFFDLRISKGAQWEIRRIAAEMLLLVVDHAPSVFEPLLEQKQAEGLVD